MTLGLAIPGVETVHPREESLTDPCYPMTGPAQDLSLVYQPVVHYSSAIDLPDGDIGEFEYQVGPYLAATNRDYWRNRDSGGSPKVICGRTLPGYAVGYLFAVDWLGGAWELRGFDIRAAANAPTNAWTFPILMLTDRVDPASPLAVATARAIFREARRRSGRADFQGRPLGHGSLPGAATACPGVAIQAQIDSGLFDLDRDEGGDVTPFKRALRAYDSRASEQSGVDPTLREANRQLVGKLGPLQPFETRRVFVGLASNAEVILHSVGHGGAGFLKLSGDQVAPTSSLINFDGADRIEDNSQMVALTDGSVWVTAGPAACDFIVEVSATW